MNFLATQDTPPQIPQSMRAVAVVDDDHKYSVQNDFVCKGDYPLVSPQLARPQLVLERCTFSRHFAQWKIVG